MKAGSSAYLSSCRPLMEKLLSGLLQKYPYASLLGVDAYARRYQVSGTGVSASENAMFSNRGFVAKVYDGKGYGEYSFNRLNEEELPRILQAVSESLMPLADALPEGLTPSEYARLSDEPVTLCESTQYETAPWEMSDESIVSRLTQMRNAGMAVDERMLDFAAGMNYRCYHKVFLSPNRSMEQNVLWTNGTMFALAARGEEIKEYYKSYSHLGGGELMDKMAADAPSIAAVALELLDSEPIPPGEYDCVCEPGVTGMIVHEAFGHGVEMDMFVKDRAVAREYIGKQVASPLVTMHDGACAAKESATYFFDDEGTLAHDTVVIRNGILEAGISDAQSAMHLGTEPTGNGRRESFERKAYTRMTNTFFEGGKDKLEDMIASISYGFLLENASSGMEDPKNWGIQCMVNIAREIKDGKLTGKIYSPIVLTGFVPDLLKSISMMSENVELGGGGACGKGYKEWVKVSDGGPYIKARIRLG